MFRFEDPQYFYLIFAVIGAVVYHFIRLKNRRPYFRYSGISLFGKIKKTLRSRLTNLPFILKSIGLIIIIVALARPRSTESSSETITEGIDIILALDISTSMLAMDFEPDRFRASIQVANDFIQGRKNDRIGMVLFAGESYTQCPLTTDYGVLKKLTENIKMGIIEDGTAIGSGIINAVNRLKNSKAESKVIILLTDGENNRGEVEPETAADVAAAMDVRIYTIGVGRSRAPYPFRGPFGKTVTRQVEFKIDEEMLSNVAQNTGGKFFRATDKDKLKSIYKEIDKLEKTKIEIRSYKRYYEKYHLFLLPGLVILILAYVLENSIFLKRP